MLYKIVRVRIIKKEMHKLRNIMAILEMGPNESALERAALKYAALDLELKLLTNK